MDNNLKLLEAMLLLAKCLTYSESYTIELISEIEWMIDRENNPN